MEKKPALKVAVTGSTGLIGSCLVDYFKEKGASVTRIVRHDRRFGEERSVLWNPVKGTIDAKGLEDQDVIVHLAGANIAGNRWTTGYKRLILQSRVTGTELLAKAITGLKTPPRVLLSASAVGYYGDHSSEELIDEIAGAGEGFLSEVCTAWEEATRPVEDAGIRVVHMRFGIVLSKDGGALAKMLPPFLMGLGGVLGSGQQMMSWIVLEEIPHAVMHLIQTSDVNGPVNMTAPNPVSNQEFTGILARVLKRPALCPVPAAAVKLLFGEMGEALLLGGAAVKPQRLIDSGYSFLYPDLEMALRAALKSATNRGGPARQGGGK